MTDHQTTENPVPQTTAGVAGQTTFLAEHKRRPTVRQDGIKAWLRDKVEYLESIRRTEFGDGSLAAYKRTLTELKDANG